MIRDLYLDYIKNSYNSIKNEPIEKGAKGLNRSLSKEDMHRSKKHMKRSSTSLSLGKMCIKTTMRYLFTCNPTLQPKRRGLRMKSTLPAP